MIRSSRRDYWLPEEDAILLRLVRTHGQNNWVRISRYFYHRSAKRCRERYYQYLLPSLNHEPIATQEGDLIEQFVEQMGRQWSVIARLLGNRSDNAVKNWWIHRMNRRKTMMVHRNGDKPSPTTMDAHSDSSDQQLPSLVSDNRSHVLIAPHILPSPPLAMLMSTEPLTRLWPGPLCRNSTGNFQGTNPNGTSLQRVRVD